MFKKTHEGHSLQLLPKSDFTAIPCNALACTSLGIVSQRGHEENAGILAVSESVKAAERRSKDRKEQYHSQVWTKAAHGGPYRKVRLNNRISQQHELTLAS